jgi:hypothetical protein
MSSKPEISGPGTTCQQPSGCRSPAIQCRDLQIVVNSIRFNIWNQFHSGAEFCSSSSTQPWLSCRCCSISAENASSRAQGMSKSNGEPPAVVCLALSEAIVCLNLSRMPLNSTRSLLPGLLTSASTTAGSIAYRKNEASSNIARALKLLDSSTNASL